MLTIKRTSSLACNYFQEVHMFWSRLALILLPLASFQALAGSIYFNVRSSQGNSLLEGVKLLVKDAGKNKQLHQMKSTYLETKVLETKKADDFKGATVAVESFPVIQLSSQDIEKHALVGRPLVLEFYQADHDALTNLRFDIGQSLGGHLKLRDLEVDVVMNYRVNKTSSFKIISVQGQTLKISGKLTDVGLGKGEAFTCNVSKDCPRLSITSGHKTISRQMMTDREGRYEISIPASELAQGVQKLQIALAGHETISRKISDARDLTPFSAKALNSGSIQWNADMALEPTHECTIYYRMGDGEGSGNVSDSVNQVPNLKNGFPALKKIGDCNMIKLEN